jgi:CDP-diacylglycerol--glycerol-3-phosphate 3-phosphatidyltransferase
MLTRGKTIAWSIAPCLIPMQKPKLACRPVRMCSGRPTSQTTRQVDKLRARIPTLLTWARVAAVPALTATGLAPVFHGQRALTCGVFVLASLTDWADGFLARRWRVSSRFGAFLDPVADKLMVAAALVLVAGRFASCVVAPILAVSAIAILTREIFISALREWMASAIEGGRDVVQVGFVGKLKTATQMFSLSILLAVKDASSPFGVLGTVFLAISAALAIYSAHGYVLAALPSFEESTTDS